MHFDFCPLLRRTFAELSQKYPYSQTLAISTGRIEGQANTRGLGVWLSQSLTFGNLAAAFAACFLGLQKATLVSDQQQVRKDALEDYGIWLSRSLHLWKLCCYLYEGKVICPEYSTTTQVNWTKTKPKFSGALLLPDPRRQWVAALYIMIIISNFRETTFAKKNVTFANSKKKTFREGSQHNMNGLRN